MVDIEMKSLLSRLNKQCTRALEAGAGMCVSRQHYEVTVEHMLHCLIEDPYSDVQSILRHFGIDPGRVQKAPAIEGRGDYLESMISLMVEECAMSSSKCGFLLFPSVARAIHAGDRSEIPIEIADREEFAREAALIARAKRVLSETHAVFVDTAPYLGNAFLEHLDGGKYWEVFWPHESHPNTRGQAAYAEAAIGLINQIQAENPERL